MQEKATQAHTEVTGEKFCSTCQKYQKLANGGAWQTTGKNIRRWVCRICAEKRGLRIPSNEPR
jgi:hypothetical protein